MDNNGGNGGLLLILILGVIGLILVGYVIWWAIGTVFGIFGYSLSFWEQIAVLIIILIISGCGIRFRGD